MTHSTVILAAAYSQDTPDLALSFAGLRESTECFVAGKSCSLDLTGVFQISSCFEYGLEACRG